MSLADQSLQFFPVSARVSVLRARGLRIKGKDGTNDAYTALQAGRETFRTPVAEKLAEPVWGGDNAAFIFTLPAESARTEQDGVPLQVRVFHRVPVGADKLLGLAVINVHELRQNNARENPQWFKLLNKAGKADKERGEVLLDIQFLKSSMSVSMIDLSDKSHSRLGKFKDKLRGKKKDGLSDSASAILPSVSQILTDSEGEMDGETEGESTKKKKNKLKSLFVPKSSMKRNSLSQSMSSLRALPDKNSSISSSTSSGLNVDASEGKKKKKFTFLTHKRNGSTDSKASNHSDVTFPSANQNPQPQIDISINGSHVYREQIQSEEVQELEEDEEGENEEEEVNWAIQEEEQKRLEEERKREAEEERKRKEKEEQHRKEEEEKERIRGEREKEAQRIRKEEEEKERIRMEREKEEDRRRMEEKEKERVRMELEREEERRKMAEEKERIRMEREKEEERRRMEEEEKERLRVELEREEERRKMTEEKERIRIERKKEEERIRMEEEEKERLRMEREEEEQRRKMAEEKERIRIEREKEEERRRNEEEKERIRMKREMDEQQRIVEAEERERQRKVKEEQRRKLEEEERIKMKRETEEQMRRMEEERKRKEDMEAEELRRKMAEEKDRKKAEEEEKMRIAEEERKKEEKKKAERERMLVEEEKLREEKRIEMERRLSNEKKAKEEEERRIAEEKEKQRKEEERVREEKERKRRKEEEQERRNMEMEERKKADKQMREEQERLRKEESLFEESIIPQSSDFTRSARISNVKPSVSVSRAPMANTNPFLDDDLGASVFNSVEERTVKKGHAPLPPQQTVPDVSRDVPKQLSHLKDVSKRQAPQPPSMLKMSREEIVNENMDQAGLEQGARKEIQHESKVFSVFQDDNQVDTNPFTCDEPVPIKHKRPAPKPGSVALLSEDKPTYVGKILTEGTFKLEEKGSASSNKDNPPNWKLLSAPDDIMVENVRSDLTDELPRRADLQDHIVEHNKPNGPSSVNMDLCPEPLVCRTDELPSMERSQTKSRAPLPPNKPKRTGDHITHHQQQGLTNKTNFEQAQENHSNKKDQDKASVSNMETSGNNITTLSTVPSSTFTSLGDKSQVTKLSSGSRWGKVVPNDAGEVREQVAPISIIRQHAVKPLSTAEKQLETHESRVTDNTQPNTKAVEAVKGPYSQLTQTELISLALRQQEQISQRDARIQELEKYIDNLLVRVMEEKPSILMTLNTKNKSM